MTLRVATQNGSDSVTSSSFNRKRFSAAKEVLTKDGYSIYCDMDAATTCLERGLLLDPLIPTPAAFVAPYISQSVFIAKLDELLYNAPSVKSLSYALTFFGTRIKRGNDLLDGFSKIKLKTEFQSQFEQILQSDYIPKLQASVDKATMSIDFINRK